jgi:hypothetical protein
VASDGTQGDIKEEEFLVLGSIEGERQEIESAECVGPRS